MEENREVKREKVRSIPIEQIEDFPEHPFKIQNDEQMQKLIESIQDYGVITPVVARRIGEEHYELISGHRRKYACKMLGIDRLPVIVRDLSRDEAVITMVDSNLQREHILPSEKAFAYKMKMEAMKRKAGRPSKDNLSPLATNLRGQRTDEMVGARSSPPIYPPHGTHIRTFRACRSRSDRFPSCGGVVLSDRGRAERSMGNH